jgi:ribosomal protein RSM22 (predicted rRNA methylase)
VLGRPRRRPGRVELRACLDHERLVEGVISRRDGASYGVAKDLAWGDPLPAAIVELIDRPEA